MKKKIIIVVIFLLVVLLLSFYILRHKPLSAQKESDTTPASDFFPNATSTMTFKDDHFEVTYPRWIRLDTSQAANAKMIKVAITDQAGCSFFLKQSNLPATSTLQAYTDKVIQGFGTNLKVNKSEVSGTKAFLDADITVDKGVILKNVSNVYQVGSTLYSAAFIGEQSVFQKTCGAVMDEIIGSVKVK